MALSDHGEKWIDVDGISTRYVEAGAGRTVVLIHGGQAGDATGGASAEDFGTNFAALAENFHVIAVDRLGQGQTDNPNSDDDWTIGAFGTPSFGILEGVWRRSLQPYRS